MRSWTRRAGARLTGNGTFSDQAVTPGALQVPPALYPVHSGRVGSLEPGKLADLAILDTDPVAAAPHHLGSIKVTQTWIGGTLRYQRP
jgi:hypothetical protein